MSNEFSSLLLDTLLHFISAVKRIPLHRAKEREMERMATGKPEKGKTKSEYFIKRVRAFFRLVLVEWLGDWHQIEPFPPLKGPGFHTTNSSQISFDFGIHTSITMQFPSSLLSQCCLASEFELEVVYSTWHSHCLGEVNSQPAGCGAAILVKSHKRLVK